MHPFPHHYSVSANAGPEGDVVLDTAGVVALASQAPVEFGGPGGRWSPESLLVAAVADCFTLGFRAIARASQLRWNTLRCTVSGTLERVDGVTRFTAFDIQAHLQVGADVDQAKARRLLDKAETSCLITNSLSAQVHLSAEVEAVAA